MTGRTVLLAIDVGNTQTVVGLYADGRWISSWRLATDSACTPDELEVKMNDFFTFHKIDVTTIDTVIIASVVPPLTSAWANLARMISNARILTVGPGIKTGLTIGILHPHELGADRIANAVGAAELYGAPVIVVDFGTATNLDVVTAEGVYKGGVISPGIATSADALFRHAARLSAVDLEAPAHALGTSTLTAVQSGLVFGEAAKVDGLVNRIWGELGYKTKVIATGGLMGLVSRYCECIDECDEMLTLEGLRVIAQRNLK